MKYPACTFLAALGSLFMSSALADTTLWYNGDVTAGGGTVNEESSNVGAARVFENFTVTSPGGWLLDRIWSNDTMNLSGVSSAFWSINSGMSAGNPGTIVASGISFATQTPTGRVNPSLPGYTEYKIEISGLNVTLGPGTYWLCVSPQIGNEPFSNGTLRSYVSVTFGANAVGTPAGTGGGGFLYWPYGGYNYAPSFFAQDYSLGVAGAVVPEPATGMMLLAGCAVSLFSRRREG